MSFGEIVTLTPTGFVVREKALRPLGIFNESSCWGVWAANPHRRHEHYGHPDLIISPFHPSSWPFLVRLRILIKNRPKALADASWLLEQNDLSIIFAECSPTGFTHATWTVIAECTGKELDKLRNEKDCFDDDKRNQKVRIPPDPSYRRARRLANKIAAHMFCRVRRLEEVFEGVLRQQEEAPHTCEPPLLHAWGSEGNNRFPYDEEKVARQMEEFGGAPFDNNLNFIRPRLPRSAEVGYMQRLAYFSIYGGGRYNEVPFRFQYKAASTSMEMESGVPFNKGSFAGKFARLPEQPMHAIGSFNTDDKYLRLCPLTPDFLRHSLTRISLLYEVEQQEHDAKASQGLLRRVCDVLHPDADLLYISNKWTSPLYGKERGKIMLAGDVDPDKYAGLEERLGAVNDEGKDGRLDAVTITDAQVIKYPDKRLFLSIHFGHPREDSIIKLAKRAALAEGYLICTVKTHTTPIAETVDDEMKNCHALLQIIFLNKEPPNDKALQWLNTEYNIARTINMRRIRLVDTSTHTYADWREHLYIEAGWALKEFRIDLSDEELGEQIHDAIRELARAPTGKSGASGRPDAL